MFSHYGFGGPEWGISASDYLAAMSMTPKTQQEKEISLLANELRVNPKFRTWCALLLRETSRNAQNALWNEVLTQKRASSSAEIGQHAETLRKKYEVVRGQQERLIRTIMGKSIHAFIPFWEERVAEKLLKLTEDGVLSKTAIEKAFDSEPKLAEYFQAAIARHLAEITQTSDQL